MATYLTAHLRTMLNEPPTSYPGYLLRDLTDCFVNDETVLLIITKCFNSPQDVDYVERYELARALSGLRLQALIAGDTDQGAKLATLFDQLYELITEPLGTTSGVA